MADPTGYGRVVRQGGEVTAVVEHKDADAATRAVREVATSVYSFDAAALADSLQRLTTDNAQGEEYLTDVVGLHRAAGLAVTAHLAEDPTRRWASTTGCSWRRPDGCCATASSSATSGPASPSSTR
jgi:bifunctional UDP-N-acetylglucosamine pyrophosphorylase/glucosamine-1-phosphate N-acetyltransferase